MALLVIIQIQVIDDIDHLAQQNAVLHVIVRILKGCLDNSFFDGCCCSHIKPLQSWEEFIIHKIKKRVARHRLTRLIISGPVIPAAFFWNN